MAPPLDAGATASTNAVIPSALPTQLLIVAIWLARSDAPPPCEQIGAGPSGLFGGVASAGARFVVTIPSAQPWGGVYQHVLTKAVLRHDPSLLLWASRPVESSAPHGKFPSDPIFYKRADVGDIVEI